MDRIEIIFSVPLVRDSFIFIGYSSLLFAEINRIYFT